MEFRTLKPNEISVRIGQVTAKGVTLLLYKDARADMTILDETVGAEYWQREHYECKGNLFCRVGILNAPLDEWIWKSDCGIESNTEKEKGEASDSFKRACVNWGIGRELYTAPFIFIPCQTVEQNGKYYIKDKAMFYGMKVSTIDYSKSREINKIEIVSQDGTQLFKRG